MNHLEYKIEKKNESFFFSYIVLLKSIFGNLAKNFVFRWPNTLTNVNVVKFVEQNELKIQIILQKRVCDLHEISC